MFSVYFQIRDLEKEIQELTFKTMRAGTSLDKYVFRDLFDNYDVNAVKKWYRFKRDIESKHRFKRDSELRYR